MADATEMWHLGHMARERGKGGGDLDGLDDDGRGVLRRAALLQQPLHGVQRGVAALAGIVVVERGDVGPDLGMQVSCLSFQVSRTLPPQLGARKWIASMQQHRVRKSGCSGRNFCGWDAAIQSPY